MTTRPLNWRSDRMWAGGLCGLLLVVVGAALLDERILLGAADTDIHLQFYASRTFGFRELAAGRIAEWNPHTYCGAPYLGSMQAALLYPPNLIFLMLPTALAINWSIALHLGLLACLMYAWCRLRGIGPEGAFLAGSIAAFGGASFLHVYAGHLSNVCTMAWTPLVFMAIDGIVAAVPRGDRRRAVNWCLAGAVAVAMQVYAGHPQYVFYTGVAAILYSASLLGSAWLGTASAAARPIVSTLVTTGLALCTFYPLGAALGAAQLLPGIAASRETIRSVPVPFSFAAMFGFPQENLITLVAPFVFGDMRQVPYWGRCYLWEMCLYVGVVGTVLAGYAAWPRRGLRDWLRQPDVVVPVGMIAVLLILALGNNTPLFSLLYHSVPGFGKFRGISKFIFPASLFIAVLAGMGFDRLRRDGRAPAALTTTTFVIAGIGLGVGFLLQFADPAPAMKAMIASQECYLPPAAVNDTGLQQQVRLGAVGSLMAAGATAAAMGLLLRVLPTQRMAIFLVLALGAGELCLFASRMVATSPVGSVPRPEIAQFLAEHPGDYRVLDLTNPDAAMAGGYRNIWGYAPDLIRRYGEFMAFTQDMDPDEATPYVNFKRIDPLYKMLRLKYAFVPRDNGIEVVECPDPLPRAFLVTKYRVIPDRDAMFAAMRDPSFDPRTEVLLAEDPGITADGSESEASNIEMRTMEHSLVVNVELRKPSMLVLTDAYASSWQARGTGGGAQDAYRVLPANHAFVAIPLRSGRHEIAIGHGGAALFMGATITLVALGLLALMVAVQTPPNFFPGYLRLRCAVNSLPCMHHQPLA